MRTLALLIGFLAVAACGGKDDSSATLPPASSPVPTPAVTTSPTSTAAPSETTAPSTSGQPATLAPTSTTSPSTTAPPTTEPATTAPVTASGPTTGIAVVYTSHGDDYPWLPVGWWDGTGWGSVEWPSPDVPLPASSFDAVSVSSVELTDGPLRAVTDYRIEDYGCIDEPGLPSIVLDAGTTDNPEVRGYRAVAVTADWDVQPRPVNLVGLDAPDYQQVGESLIAGTAEIDPTRGDVTQVVRSDLDGDGIEEVLFAFEYAATDTGMATAGDFSILVARYPKADGTVVDDVLFEHLVQSPVEYPSLDRGRVVAIADVNGDGVMEVAIGVTQWESATVALHEFREGELHQVMSSGCGV